MLTRRDLLKAAVAAPLAAILPSTAIVVDRDREFAEMLRRVFERCSGHFEWTAGDLDAVGGLANPVLDYSKLRQMKMSNSALGQMIDVHDSLDTGERP